MAIAILVFIGFAALAIDLARVANFKSELKGIADAAAMSAALDLSAGRDLNAVAIPAVNTLVANNPIEGTGRATVSAITPVTWNFTDQTATTGVVWTAANAVQATVTYQLNWTFGRVFRQGTSRVLTETSVAALGQRITHNCLRPFVFPLAALMERIGPANRTTLLTAADVYSLASKTTPKPYTFLLTADATSVSSFGWAKTSVGAVGTTADVENALAGCVSEGVGATSTLTAMPNVGSQTTVQNAVATLCGGSVNGGVRTCNPNTRILVPIYESGTNTNGTVTTVITTTPEIDQTYTLPVDKACYQKVEQNGWTSARNAQCKTFAAKLPVASNSNPVYFTSGSATVACRSGPGSTPTLSSTKVKGADSYFLRFPYTTCFKTTTTTTGNTLNAATYVIRYIATFFWTTWSTNASGTTATITGYFSTTNLPPAGLGTWDDTPGPIPSAVLVR